MILISSAIKNAFFLLLIILLNDFHILSFSPSKSILIKAAKSFLDEDDTYKLQMNGNTIDDDSREYVPPVADADEDISSDEIHLKVVEDKQDNDGNIKDKANNEKNKKNLNKKAGEIKEDVDEVDDLMGTNDKKKLKAKIMKMMKLLKDLDSDDEEEADDENDTKALEDNEESDTTDASKNSNKNEKELTKHEENDENDEENDENDEENDENEEENDEAKEISDDFSILDSPNNDNDDIQTSSLRKSKNCKNSGQGMKAKNHKGEWDKVKIQEVSDWPELCKNGLQQSPIRIQLSSSYRIEPFRIDIDYHEVDSEYIELLNDGNKLYVKGFFGNLQYGDHMFKSKEIHLHHPSEHTFGEDELRTDMEIQIVNEDNAGMKMIVSLFLHDFNKKNPTDDLQDSQKFIRGLLGVGDGDEEDELNNLQLLNVGKKRKILKNDNLDLNLLIHQIENYISYYGSITTPPCTEGVKWVIIRQKIAVSSFEIHAFQTIFGKETNVRGLQELGDRELYMF